MSGDVTREDIRSILRSDHLFGVDGDIADDTPLTLDSLAMVWLVHRLQEEHGAGLDLEAVSVADFESVEAIHAVVERSR